MMPAMQCSSLRRAVAACRESADRDRPRSSLRALDVLVVSVTSLF